MGMDGLFRPSQSLGYTDTLGHLNAAERVKQEARQAHQVSQYGEVEAVGPDPHEREESEKQPKQEKDTAFEDELKDLITDQFNINFEAGVIYRFKYNESNDKIELFDTSTQKLLLSLTPDEFIRVTENMRRDAGIMTDRSA